MPTPVGPVPGDPNDPDLWQEWYEGDGDGDGGGGGDRRPGFRWSIRLVALIVALGIASLLVFAR